MIDIQVDSGDLQRVVNRMTRFNRNVRQGCQREVNHSALSVQRIWRQLLTEQGAVATNRLRSSVNIRRTSDRLGAVIGSNVSYGPDVEYGQKPGRWPNVASLIQWVRIKITRNPKQARSIAFLIGRKIFREGTKAKPAAQPAADKVWPVFRNNIQKVLKMS